MSIASDAIAGKTGYAFRDGSLLEAALTHSSTQKKDGDNERLEFLGDRVLGLVVATMLYRSFPSEKEGDLAKRHTALVQQKALADVAERLGLADHLRVSSGERKAGGLHKETILADAVEALIGAVYLDGGYLAAEKFVETLWQDALHSPAPPEDAKTLLQEWAQARGLPLPEYIVKSRTGADHAPVFEIELSVRGRKSVCAQAPSKRQAEKAAAARMLDEIEKESRE